MAHTRERTKVKLIDPTSVDFSNLRDGYSVYSPFRVDFSVRGMGVIPAGKPLAQTGHHHILIDTRLPSNITAPIPFNDLHRHFGKAQTGTTLTLPRGEHTVRLLFADHDHRPHFVFSPELKLNVLGPRPETPPRIAPNKLHTSCEAWDQEEMSCPCPEGNRAVILNLRDGESVVSLSTCVSGLTVLA